MQRNLLLMQQQQQAAMARQAQQRASAAMRGMDMGVNVNGIQTPDQLWAQQQRLQQQRPQQPMAAASLFQSPQQALDNERLQQLQQQRMTSMYTQPPLKPMQQQTTGEPIVPQLQQPPVKPPAAIPVETDAQKRNLDQYVDRDQKYQETLDTQHKRHMELAQSKKLEIDVANNDRRLRNANKSSTVFGVGYDGFGNGRTGTQSRILYPSDKKRKRNQPMIRIPYEAAVEQAKKEETLVPIRIDLESDGYKVRDTFTWNMNETSITPEQFAEITCDDLRLPASTFSPLIAANIREQIQEFFDNASSMVKDEDEEEANAYEEISKYKKQKLQTESMNTLEEKSTDNTHKKNFELRTLIKLDIIVGNRILNDQFEWDITCKKNSPESFAEAMATDLGLGGEFKTAIAHSIREQVYVYIKSLLLTGYEFGDGPIENDELRRSFLPTIDTIFRDSNSIEKFTPSLIEVSDAEIAKIEKVRTRESRRKRRGVRNRKGSTLLPDREPVPTFRTIFAQPPDSDLTEDQYNITLPNQESLASLHSQRKSAMKARMNIAAEAAGVSLTSGQLENGTLGEDYVPLQGNTDIVTRPVPSKMLDATWRCADCGISPFMTTIVRAGPAGDKSLCNACGLYRYKYNTMRPQNYMDKDIKNDIPHLNDWQNYMSKYKA